MRANVILVFCLVLFSCEQAGDSIRNWGVQSRHSRAREMQEEELKKWERDLALSRSRAQELHKKIHELVQESNHQGQLAWKIARAYMNSNRFEEGIRYFDGALQNQLPPANATEPEFEAALPYINLSLQKHYIHGDLLFEAGLCYANASRVMGWERKRWQAAVDLFSRMKVVEPEDTRSSYQLALLYGKVPHNELRDSSRARDLLREVIAKEELNIPAYFTLAHLEVESGELAEGLRQYRLLQERLADLQKKGVIGDLQKNQQYIQAGKNIEMLEICLERRPGCELRMQ